MNLPEWPKLFAKFGSHRGCRGRGPVCAEVCCLFAVLPRIPLAWITAKSSTNERPMFKRLVGKLRKGDLLLADNGFFSFGLLEMLVQRGCSFIIPIQKKSRPKVIRKLGDHDWLVEIADSKPGSDKTMQLRMVYVYRRGFRRRRILTSLLDPVKYSPAELASVYHLRWDIETFYRDFKKTMQARIWHCQSPDNFEKELAMHMIAVLLIRRAMLEAAGRRRTKPAMLSFARALTEARVFLIRIAGAVAEAAHKAYDYFVGECARHKVRSKPGRSFSRDQQEYRARARGLKKKPRGRPPKQVEPFAAENSQPETLTDGKGRCYALS